VCGLLSEGLRLDPIGRRYFESEPSFGAACRQPPGNRPPESLRKFWELVTMTPLWKFDSWLPLNAQNGPMPDLLPAGRGRSGANFWRIESAPALPWLRGAPVFFAPRMPIAMATASAARFEAPLLHTGELRPRLDAWSLRPHNARRDRFCRPVNFVPHFRLFRQHDHAIGPSTSGQACRLRPDFLAV